jgi:hypothetical protein
MVWNVDSILHSENCWGTMTDNIGITLLMGGEVLWTATFDNYGVWTLLRPGTFFV